MLEKQLSPKPLNHTEVLIPHKVLHSNHTEVYQLVLQRPRVADGGMTPQASAT